MRSSTPETSRARARWGCAARRHARLAALVLALGIVCCGRKTEVKPPQLVAPHAVTQLALSTLADGVTIAWNRPTEYVDGSTMEDLGGFVIERSRNNEHFSELTRVQVTDRGRFQKTKRFEYVDHAVMQGATYHYRVVAFTTDGYYSTPSGAATITWEPAAPSPSPEGTPAAAASPRHRTRKPSAAPPTPQPGAPDTEER